MTSRPTIRSTCAAILLLAVPTYAQSADYGAPAAIIPEAIISPGLWRGHFSGGVNVDPYADDIALVWTDRAAFFPDNLSCRRWIRDLKARFATYQGFTGCLRIR